LGLPPQWGRSSSISSASPSLLVRPRHHDQIALTISTVEGERVTGIEAKDQSGVMLGRGRIMSAQLYRKSGSLEGATGITLGFVQWTKPKELSGGMAIRSNFRA
jgi:hypothetical protein